MTVPCRHVPKTLTCIRVVLNFNGNGLNPSIYTPSFFLPASDTIYRNIEVDM